MEKKFTLIYESIINDAIDIYRGIFKNTIRRHLAEGAIVPTLMRFNVDVLYSYIRDGLKYRLGLIDADAMQKSENKLYDRLYYEECDGMNQIINDFVEKVETKPLPNKLKELMLQAYKNYMPKKYRQNEELLQTFYDSMDGV